MCDETKKTDTAPADDSRKGSTMPDCCGPMAERMFKAFSETEEGAPNTGSTADSGAGGVGSFASVIERMASRCCGRDPQKTTNGE